MVFRLPRQRIFTWEHRNFTNVLGLILNSVPVTNFQFPSLGVLENYCPINRAFAISINFLFPLRVPVVECQLYYTQAGTYCGGVQVRAWGVWDILTSDGNAASKLSTLLLPLANFVFLVFYKLYDVR